MIELNTIFQYTISVFLTLMLVIGIANVMPVGRVSLYDKWGFMLLCDFAFWVALRLLHCVFTWVNEWVFTSNDYTCLLATWLDPLSHMHLDPKPPGAHTAEEDWTCPGFEN